MKSRGTKSLDAVRFLFSKGRPPPVAVNDMFETTHCVEMMKLLYELTSVSKRSIIAVFEEAAGVVLRKRAYFRYNDDKLDIVKMLHKDTCIPAKVISEAFVIAARYDQAQLVELMQDDTRISEESRCEAFKAAAACQTEGLMESLFRESFCSDTIWVAFKQAYLSRKRANVKFLLNLVCEGDQDLRNKVVLNAVKFGE
ncbi:hypothetical protein PC119_g12512 [Phytophthora cactorum]|nr:hypothetical protein PC112_g5720 [Phytophthora cactorum]KAG3013418.1 hypothetical protein PC119_g12512 [Phytophthora cactorum]KAG3103069.1 hypothetical protein PC122_g1980 [Phytophthora cactorum]KAG3200235.1 hypothetical protein PC128_g4705 [Phytophthora cactorum]